MHKLMKYFEFYEFLFITVFTTIYKGERLQIEILFHYSCQEVVFNIPQELSNFPEKVLLSFLGSFWPLL